MKGVVRLLAMTVLIVMVSAVVVPVIAESWQTRYGPGTLEEDDVGPYVKNLQTDLKRAQCFTAVTGTFDADTVNAVKRFQAQKGLTVDGKAGPATKSALWNTIN